jgi:hypothetical protein
MLPRFLRLRRLQAELEVRFQTALSRPQAHASRGGGGGGGGKQHYRSGDLLDPRSRTKRHVDVVVQTHQQQAGGAMSTGIASGSGGSGGVRGGMVVWEQPPFVVLALKVEHSSEDVGRAANGADGCGDDSLREPQEQAERSPQHQDKQQQQQEKEHQQVISGVVLGFFRPETFSKMDISVAAGQRMRIYDYVLLSGLPPPPSSSSSGSSCLPGAPILLCTSLCEAL